MAHQVIYNRWHGQWQINGELFDAEADHTPRALANLRNAIPRNSSEVWTFKTGGGAVPAAQRFRSDVHQMWENAREIEVARSFRDFPDPAFNPPGGAEPGRRGRYVIHSHNTTHEDHAMMQTWNVVNPNLV